MTRFLAPSSPPPKNSQSRQPLPLENEHPSIMQLPKSVGQHQRTSSPAQKSYDVRSTLHIKLQALHVWPGTMRVCIRPWISVVAAVLALVNRSAGLYVSVAGKALRRSSFSLGPRESFENDTPTTRNMNRPGRSSSSSSSSNNNNNSGRSSSRRSRREKGTTTSMRSDAGQQELGAGFDFGTR